MRLRNTSLPICKKYTATGLENQPSSVCGIHKGQSAILHSMHIYFDVVVCGQQGMKSNHTTDIYTMATSLRSGKGERPECEYN